ncbi:MULTISPECIES: leucine-rich repeat domain-containing protein [unclassified Chryseobacterium]|uniref:leucine-rich repeat domain-containing protein n=1 Tax=unclassified Chryseobacterium TaxID=2593645 RepID=UPI000D389B7E|nr:MULTISPECIES: leucine-rich repeat domain-containing protein [unclassified Chryseobacterium]PTT69500.1 hypothetical protein DBR25_19140 [Chryseobacterium sp. HMWF001]PVV49386.1 hypothetical protein DD829_22900 [Chryseobacterium sp. HMWF035]
MSDPKTITQKLEDSLNIKFEEWDRKIKKSGKSYYDGYNNLYLSNLHFEDFSALEPVFDKIHYLTLTECSIASLEDIDKINLQYLTLRKCSIEATFDPDIPKAKTSHGHFQCLILEEMNLPHPGFFLPVSNHLEYVTFTKCTVNNIHELNLFPALYSLTINDTNFIESKSDIQYQRNKGKFTFLDFENMKLKNFNLFIPISNGVSNLSLHNCEVESLKSICQFPDLKKLGLYPDIKIHDLIIPDHDIKPFELERCVISRQPPNFGWDPDWTIQNFDTKLLASIAPYIKHLMIEDYNLTNTGYLENFSKLNELYFNRCSIDLNDYSSIAPQIQKIRFEHTEVKNQKAFKYFTKLEDIEFDAHHPDKKNHYIDVKKLLPLKGFLKAFNAFDWNKIRMIRNQDELKHFTALEKIETSTRSLELAQDILSIKSLKKLQLTIEKQNRKIAEPITLDLQELKNIENLWLSTFNNFYFEGLGHLKSLQTLTLSDDGDLENLALLPALEKLIVKGEIINKLPRLEQLKILDLKIEKDCEVPVALLNKFPNLEKLKVSFYGEQKIDFSGLDKLKVLICECYNFENVIAFENLLNLEELDLSRCEISRISKLDHLINLKTLDLAENYIESLKGLEKLKNLERLNLSDHKISDFSLLNIFPKLREVNVPSSNIKKEDIEQQLDKPEILLWVYSPFRIGLEKSLYISGN